MNRWQEQVAEFHRLFGVIIGDKPAIRDRELRAALIAEEAREACQAIMADNLVDAVDGLVDTIYVCLGAAVTFGVDLAPIFNEIHRTNLAKVGGSVRSDGKILKPPEWRPPRVAKLLDEQDAVKTPEEIARELWSRGIDGDGDCSPEGCIAAYAKAIRAYGVEVAQERRLVHTQELHFCPSCRRDGEKSRVMPAPTREIPLSPEAIVGPREDPIEWDDIQIGSVRMSSYWWDEDGVRHVHWETSDEYSFCCNRGHRWTEISRRRCPAECGFGEEAIQYVLSEGDEPVTPRS